MSRRARVPARTVGALLGAGAVVVSTLGAVGAPDAGATTVTPTRSTLVVSMRGNGHGHGMSQYGAQGAAIAGLHPAQITAFYYPGTAVRTLHRSWIRVRVSGFGSTVTVAPSPQLWVHGMTQYLPTAGVRRYRLVANAGTGTSLQRLGTAAGSTWRTVYSSLPSGEWFHRRGYTPIRVYRPDGGSIAYRGLVSAVRVHRSGTAGGVYTVNHATLDQYTAGVVPREMPISWRPAATEAQALAARTYGRYNVLHPRSSAYDICDTTMCQVYGGAARYGVHGKQLWSDAPWVARATSNKIITYHGAAIFAQFSASNGGWTAAGGQPYLVSRRDPYDNARSGDPYLSYRRTVTTAGIARHYGLARLTRIEITTRVAGGRIGTAYVSGVTSAGHAHRIRTDGSNLSWAVGAGTTWLSFANP